MRRAIVITTLGLFIAGCNDQTAEDTALRAIIEHHALTGDPLAEKTIPSVNEPIVQLGKQLFFSKSLSGNRDVACVSCHHPLLGGGDNLSLAIGVDAVLPDWLGTGRVHSATAIGHDSGPPVPRNSPTTFNLAGWDKVLFHDGRIEKMAEGQFRTPDVLFGSIDPNAGNNLAHAQARFPLTSNEEMKGFDHDDKDNQGIRDFIASRLGGYGEGAELLPDTQIWLSRFRAAFNQPNASAEELITEQNITALIGDYELSQAFTETPWKAYVQGADLAISEEAKKGALLFYRSRSEGGADCASCHTGDFFTDEGFHNIAMPQMGRGKGDGDGSEDFGRFRETGEPMDKYAFRTPSLLNVEVTKPWGHSGAYTSLEAVVKHHLDTQTALDNYDYGQLEVGIQNLEITYSNTQRALSAPSFALEKVEMTDIEVGYLVEFLKTLTDPCTKSRECLTPWIAEPAIDTDANGDLLVPVNL